MSHPRRQTSTAPIIAFLLGATLAIGSVPTLAAPGVEPDGSINGKIAIKVFPEGSVPSEGCNVRLVEADDQTRKLTYGCDTWFQPPVGRYLFWVEQDDNVSFQSLITYAGEPFDRSGLALGKTMCPAGHVRMDRSTSMPEDATLRLLSLDPASGARAFDRRLRSADANEAIVFPVGGVIAGVFDRNGRAQSLSTPQSVRPGGMTIVRPEPPTHGKAGVVAVLDRPPRSSGRCEGALVISNHSLRPTAGVQTDERIVLVWYGLAAPEDASLTVTCAGGEHLDDTVHLRRGDIETVRKRLIR